MIESLDRHELPIQSIRERDWDLTATVPVHLSILGLQPDARTNPKLISDAQGAIRQSFNEDMEYYLEILKGDGQELNWLKGYERFRDDWAFSGEVDESGFLRLNWSEAGGTQSIGLVEIPVILQNRHNEQGQFNVPENTLEGKNIEIIYRSRMDPEIVFMAPQKMRQYGEKTTRTYTDLEEGFAEVDANAFCSDYQQAMPQAMLLRNFGVLYLNRLLETSQERLH